VFNSGVQLTLAIHPLGTESLNADGSEETVHISTTEIVLSSSPGVFYSADTDQTGQTTIITGSSSPIVVILSINGESNLAFTSQPEIFLHYLIANIVGDTAIHLFSNPIISNVQAYTVVGATNYLVIYRPAISVFSEIEKKTIIGRRYLMTMAGAPDLKVPISSINGRLRSEGQSTLTVVCPDGVNYVSGILSRVANGFFVTLIETYLDGTEESTDSQLFTNISPSHDHGARNFSVTLTGYSSLSFPLLPRRINVQGVQYQAMQSNGARRVRSGLDKDIKPKDIALLPSGEEIIIDAVTYTIGTRQASMELTEAA